jgi:hypothetical protein
MRLTPAALAAGVAVYLIISSGIAIRVLLMGSSSAEAVVVTDDGEP